MGKFIALAWICSCLCGCGATLAIGPDRVFTLDEKVQALRAYQDAGPTSIAERNNLITERSLQWT